MGSEEMVPEKSELVVVHSDTDGSRDMGVAVGSDAADADEAMKVFEVIQHEHLQLDAAASKRLLRKIDMVLMPVRATLTRFKLHAYNF